MLFSVILAFRDFEHPVFLERGKRRMCIGVRFYPGLVGWQAFYRAKQPLIVCFKHAFFYQLLMVVKQLRRVFGSMGIKPIEYKPGAEHCERFGSNAAA